MTPTIQLEHNELKFTFPEITHQLNTLLDRHMQQLPSALRLPDDRSKLVRAVTNLAQGPEWSFRTHREDSESPPMSLEDTARCLTAADVESALRAIIRFPPPIVRVVFERALRIPDDGKEYTLPANLGDFPLRSVDDFANTLPAEWVKRGGVIMPMYQSEAMCIRFSSSYPFAVKIAFGKINAVSGEPSTDHLQQHPQNYILVPEQSWLDGFSVGEGLIRQFVAVPLGKGYSVEEQLTSKANIGGVEIQAYPVNADMFFRTRVLPFIPVELKALLPQLFLRHLKGRRIEITRFRSRPPQRGGLFGLEGYTRAEIYKSPYSIAIWDQTQTQRCCIHLCNSQLWRQFTHTEPPHPPVTAKEYKSSKIPWFNCYREDQPPRKVPNA